MGTPLILLEQFLKLVMNRIKAGVNVIFSFSDIQKRPVSLLEELGGKIYRENMLMKYVKSEE